MKSTLSKKIIIINFNNYVALKVAIKQNNSIFSLTLNNRI